MTWLAGVVIGLVAGVASGVAGIGGGVIMIPAMVALLAVPQHLAEGTSLLAILFTAASGTVVNVRNRRARLRAALLVGLGGAATAPVGAGLALYLPADTLRRIFGAFVVWSGLRMAWRLRRPRPLLASTGDGIEP